MNKTVKTIVCIALAILSCVLVYLIYRSIMKPVNFGKEMAVRSNVAIQRLKDIRTLQVAYKSENGRYLSTLDSLKAFYENGTMAVTMKEGSIDDSAKMEHTKVVVDALKKKNRKIKDEEINKALYELFKAGDGNLVFEVRSDIPVKDTLFRGRTDFCIDSLFTIPFSGGAKTGMVAITKKVSGVDVPLFEATMPYQDLLKDMDRQLVINLKAEKNDQGKFPGLQVGSISAPNNNAGNWE